jgi:hypothetical protein
MEHRMKSIVTIFGGVCGAVVGLLVGFFAAVGLGCWSQMAHPNDPSAGSVAIVIIFTAPCGLVGGAILGGQTITKRPRLFCATIVPLAILFVAFQATLSTLRGMDRPRNFVLEVDGTHGAEYVGLVLVDGGLAKQRGALPAKFEFTGFQIEMAFVLAHADENNKILVNASADGKDLETGTESATGVHQQLRSFGYSETFGGTSTTWSRMSQEEVEALIKDETMPQAVWNL